jgi:hypothetical protein
MLFWLAVFVHHYATLRPSSHNDSGGIWLAYQANEVSSRQDILLDFIAMADDIHTIGI